MVLNGDPEVSETQRSSAVLCVLCVDEEKVIWDFSKFSVLAWSHRWWLVSFTPFQEYSSWSLKAYRAIDFLGRDNSLKKNSFDLWNYIFCIVHAVAYPRILFAFLKWAKGMSYHQKSLGLVWAAVVKNINFIVVCWGILYVA